MLNRKYIFNPGPFSSAMLVYRSVSYIYMYTYSIYKLDMHIYLFLFLPQYHIYTIALTCYIHTFKTSGQIKMTQPWSRHFSDMPQLRWLNGSMFHLPQVKTLIWCFWIWFFWRGRWDIYIICWIHIIYTSLLLLSWVLYGICYNYLPLAEKLPKYLGTIHNAIMAPCLQSTQAYLKILKKKKTKKKHCRNSSSTLDGRNPAPPGIYKTL